MTKLSQTTARPDGKKLIAENRLVRLPNPVTGRRYTVDFKAPEFTCLCPVSGLPDFATILIRYQPRKWIVELKSLKLYFNGYRDRGIFHEAVVNVILDDLNSLLQPWEIEVTGDFNVRGNIKTIVTASERA